MTSFSLNSYCTNVCISIYIPKYTILGLHNDTLLPVFIADYFILDNQENNC